MNTSPSFYAELPRAGLLRRLAAMFYDALLVVAIWFVTGFVAVALNSGEAVTGPGFQSVLLLLTYGFFAWFWTHNGQTLGMQAWQVRVQNPDGTPINLTQSLLRFFGAGISMACLGLGYWWMLFDKDGLTWHDRLSDSRMVVVPKPK